jgi:hydrogenase maturation protease
VLIVDAVAFGGFPGECCLLDAASLDTAGLSTHAGSLSILSDYLSARTEAQVKIMAIQPQRIDAREGLSLPVEKSVLELATMLSDLLAAGKLVRCHNKND